jgi:hypothetical protein
MEAVVVEETPIFTLDHILYLLVVAVLVLETVTEVHTMAVLVAVWMDTLANRTHTVLVKDVVTTEEMVAEVLMAGALAAAGPMVMVKPQTHTQEVMQDLVEMVFITTCTPQETLTTGLVAVEEEITIEVDTEATAAAVAVDHNIMVAEVAVKV